MRNRTVHSGHLAPPRLHLGPDEPAQFAVMVTVVLDSPAPPPGWPKGFMDKVLRFFDYAEAWVDEAFKTGKFRRPGPIVRRHKAIRLFTARGHATTAAMPDTLHDAHSKAVAWLDGGYRHDPRLAHDTESRQRWDSVLAGTTGLWHDDAEPSTGHIPGTH